jgi:potassium/sodium efflux P-type ATPase
MPELTYAIIAVIIINGIFSFWQEYRAEKTTKELQKLIPQNTRIIREGAEKKVPTRDIVPGDIVVLSEGDRIPADARLIKDFQILTDESTLTGESQPVPKFSHPLAPKTVQHSYQLPNIVFGGTNVASGSGVAVVFATGMNMEFGKIAHLAETVEEEPSPLQKELKRVTQTVTMFAIFLGVIVFATSEYLGLGFTASFLFAIGIIIANVPEGLLPTVTLSLGMGMQRMAKRRAIIKRLSSVETLGCTSVICTDKTGTLTCNEMTVTNLWVSKLNIKVTGTGYEPEGSFSSSAVEGLLEERIDFKILLSAGMTCNDSRLVPPTDQNIKWNVLGDPTEGALLVAALKAGMTYPPPSERIALLPFDSKRKRMSIVVKTTGNEKLAKNEIGLKRAYVKGAPAELLDLCENILHNNKIRPLEKTDQESIKNQIDDYAKQGLRVLGIAYRDLSSPPDKLTIDNVERELTFVGLVAMMDPPRPEVEEAIKKCKEAGIRILMLTGDYGLTAEVIARRLGIISKRAKIITGRDIDSQSDEWLKQILHEIDIVFARITPDHKLRIVTALQALGHVVAMTGDGVNDSPALKKADIGVAMGVSGTDVAKEAAAMIITDDNFASIVNAVEEGRTVYDNIRKFTRYIFTSNVPEIIPFILFALARVPLALTVMQILAIDLGTDMAPSLALGAEPPEHDVMKNPPRKLDKSLLTPSLLAHAFLFLGSIEALAAMGGFYWMNMINGYSIDSPAQPGTEVYVMATTMTLVTIVFCQIGNVFVCRTERSSSLKRSLKTNSMIPKGIFIEILIILSLVYLPFLQPAFGTAALSLEHWLFPLIFAPIILLADEFRMLIFSQRRRIMRFKKTK